MTPPRVFRKKPIEIQAVQVCEIIMKYDTDRHMELPDWIRFAVARQNVTLGKDYAVVTTLEGQMVGNFSDWIIRGVQGELYPCQWEIFDMTYEEVTE